MLAPRGGEESSSRLVKNLLAAAASSREDGRKEKPLTAPVPPFSTADHNRAMPRRPPSANATKRRSRSSSVRARQQAEIENTILPDRSARLSKYVKLLLGPYYAS